MAHGTAAGDADTAVHIAETYFTTRNYARAEEVVRAALAADPHHPGLLNAYARARLGASDYAAAASSAHASLVADPDNEHTMRVYARALEGQGRLPEALWMAWRTATRHPFNKAAHYSYARLLENVGRHDDAMTVVNEALRLSPNDTDALVLRGDIYISLRKPDLAEADYREALRVDPQDADAVHSLAMMKYARGSWWSAIHGFLGAGRLDPSYGDVARQNVGVVLTTLLRRSTWLVLIVAIAVLVTSAMHEDGDSTVVPRIVAGVFSVVLFVTYMRVLHELPWRTMKSVLRRRQLLAVRMIQVFSAVIFGVQTAVMGAMTAPALLSALLILSLPVVVILGRLTGERLW